jgi:hypothetical protein
MPTRVLIASTEANYLKCVMMKRIFATVPLTLAVVTPLSFPIATALAKQQCSVSAPSNHGYWSWRLIDGRKCWYEGKPMLSKSALEWPRRTADHPSSAVEERAFVPTVASDNPSDAQAKATDYLETFEALWHARVGDH